MTETARSSADCRHHAEQLGAGSAVHDAIIPLSGGEARRRSACSADVG
ncbi:hypothetical protein [Salinarimonas rosea]